MLWAFQPTLAVGRGIDFLSREDQIAYLILVDQMKSNRMLDQRREEGSVLSIGVETGEAQGCVNPSPALDQALSEAWAFRHIRREPANCTATMRHFLYVGGRWNDSYQGGYSCGGLCGAGSFYRAIDPFGMLIVLRTGEFVN